jgi:hypothetical protein
MRPDLLSYRCRQCGAASYRRLTHRGDDGVMHYSDRFKCSGCRLVFSDLAEWRIPEERVAPNHTDGDRGRSTET